jgi:hypothetical protein
MGRIDTFYSTPVSMNVMYHGIILCNFDELLLKETRSLIKGIFFVQQKVHANNNLGQYYDDNYSFYFIT